ncbi:MAG: hypothetical protein WBP94_11385, partial [Rhodomicrobiaceae bacterium]
GPYALPVPVSHHPAAKAASLRKKRKGMLSSITKSANGVSFSSRAAAFGSKLLGAIKPTKKSRQNAAIQRPGSTGGGRELQSQSLRDRLPQVDPALAHRQAPNGPPPGQSPPVSRPLPAQTAGIDAGPDYRPPEPVRGRRRGA